jgi:hypothetical protein
MYGFLAILQSAPIIAMAAAWRALDSIVHAWED